MRRFPVSMARLAPGALALALITSCAGAPPPAKPAVTAPAPVRKERILVFQVPYLVKETRFYPDGLVDEYSVFAYDPTNRILLSKTTFDPSRADPIEKVVSELGADGRLAAELSYGPDGALRTRREVVWGGDKSLLLAGERLLDGSGLLQGSSSWDYDAGGRRTAWKTFDEKGLLKGATAYKYDEGGRLLLRELRNAAGTVTGSIRTEWAADGTEKDSYLGADGVLQRYELRMWKDGRVTRFETHRADGSLAEAVDYNYGPQGERLGAVTSDGAGKVKEKSVAEYALREDRKTEVYYE